jgi:hypothetical protein
MDVTLREVRDGDLPVFYVQVSDAHPVRLTRFPYGSPRRQTFGRATPTND